MHGNAVQHAVGIVTRGSWQYTGCHQPDCGFFIAASETASHLQQLRLTYLKH